MAKEQLRRFREKWKNAFDLKSPHGPLTDEDRALMDKIARTVVKRRMAMPAILFLGSVKPLNAIGSQALVFLQPFLSGVFNEADYRRVTEILERREGIEALMKAIEAAEKESGKDVKP